MKTTKRITSLLFALCIICSLMIPTTAFAATCECGREIPDEMVLPHTDKNVIQTPDEITYGNEKGYPITVDGEAIDFARKGVIEVEDSDVKFVYGTSRDHYHKDTADWFLCDDGIYRTAEGFIVVASKDHEEGDIVETPFGYGIVLDTCTSPNYISIYTNY